MKWSLIVLALLAPQAAAKQQQVRFAAVVLDHPCPEPKANFGHATCVLDMDGTGALDVAVGAYGQGKTFVLHDVSMAGVGGRIRPLSATGPIACDGVAGSDKFGYDVAAGNLDGDPQDELVVGAPSAVVGPVEQAGMVFIFRHVGDTDPVILRELNPQPSYFGDSVTVGDFNGDGLGDVAVAAPKYEVAGVAAGAVHVFFGPFDTFPPSLVIENPQPVLHGNFGNHLAVGDINLDGIDDLVVGAIGNSNQAGIPVAGQVYVYPGPIDLTNRLLIEDPVPDANDLPAPRFAMHVDAREDWVIIGANRKDWLGVHDAGMGFSARGPTLGPVTLHPHPITGASDYMGFRCAVADVVGDSALDLTFVVMGQMKQLVTWDGNAPQGPPVLLRNTLPKTADHFANGLVAAQVVPGGRDELVVGDGTYDAPGATNNQDNTGRVVIYAYD